jgi:putative membrane protein
MKPFKIIILLIAIISCREKSNPDLPHKLSYSQKNNKSVEKTDVEFLKYAAEMNLKAIKLAELARQNSIKLKTQTLAKDFELMHVRLYGELKNLAGKKSIPLPDSFKENNTYKKLSSEIADDFEKKYFDIVVTDYKIAIEKFESASSISTDQEIKLWAKSTVPQLRKNLGTTLILQADANKKKNLR